MPPKIYIVAAICKGLGIGKDNKLPWHIKEDLINFKNLTENKNVIMGRKTYDSIGKPLANRNNIILSRGSTTIGIDYYNNIVMLNNKDNSSILEDNQEYYVIGGAEIYKLFLNYCDKLYITYIDKNYECDTLFPEFTNFKLTEYSEKKYSEEEKCHYQYLTFERNDNKHEEYNYLNLMNDIISTTKDRQDRTNVGTYSTFGKQLTFNIADSIPLLTTKFVSMNMVIKELLFFLRGETNSKILENQGVNIWKDNTTREFLDKNGLTDYEEGDMGPMYGISLRHFNAEYKGCNHDYTNQGYDQITNLIENIKKDPYSRRHIITTFNPAVANEGVLYPCHGIVIQFYIDDDRLSCHVYNRSQDVFLGQPWNIVSYALLTYIIGLKCNYKPDRLIISMGDAHIYKNHIEQVNTQCARKPFPFPKLQLDQSIKDKDFKDIKVEDFNLIGYLYHPSIKAPMAI